VHLPDVYLTTSPLGITRSSRRCPTSATSERLFNIGICMSLSSQNFRASGQYRDCELFNREYCIQFQCIYVLIVIGYCQLLIPPHYETSCMLIRWNIPVINILAIESWERSSMKQLTLKKVKQIKNWFQKS
jgi:hypothetical protein